MGLPETVPMSRDILDWLNKDAGTRIFCVAGCWYSRPGKTLTARRHESLLDAALHCMALENAPPPEPHWSCKA